MNERENSQHKKIGRFLRAIYATEPEELSDQQANIQMERCADELLSEADARLRYPRLWRYFETHPGSKTEFDLLMRMASEYAAGEVLTPAALPPLPHSTRSFFWDPFIQPLLLAFSGFAGSLAFEAVRGSGQALGEPVLIPLPGLEAELELVLTLHAGDPDRRDLVCTVLTEDAEMGQALEFAPLRLMRQDETLPPVEKALDTLGEVIFEALPSGHYILDLLLQNKHYKIPDFDLP